MPVILKGGTLEPMSQQETARYYLQVVSSDEEPQWPEDENELIIGQKSLGRGFTQYWAYPKNEGKTETEEPHAEVIASGNPTPYPAVLIDQPYGTYDRLELILVKDGHAWAKTESNLYNLEENITSTLEFASSKLNINVEHFMTTDRVSPEVEAKLDEFEESNGAESTPKTAVPEEENLAPAALSHGNTFPGREDPFVKESSAAPLQSPRGKQKFSKIAIVIPVIFLIAAFSGVVFFREQLLAKFNGFQKSESAPVAVPTVTPTATPTPIPVDRSKTKVRVLNGTTKTGSAGSLADKLKELGWTIDKVGNNSNQSVAQTQVRVKSTVESSISATLVADLAPDLTATVSSDLKSSDKADAEVVIGKE